MTGNDRRYPKHRVIGSEMQPFIFRSSSSDFRWLVLVGCAGNLISKVPKAVVACAVGCVFNVEAAPHHRADGLKVATVPNETAAKMDFD